MKVAIVYDRVNKWGGAERVLLALHELFPKATLFTSVYNKEKAPWAKVFSIRTSFLQDFPFAKDAHELYPLLMPAAFESLNFDDFDLVISVTSEAAKGIITKPHTKHICYCLTPTRYLWSGYATYFQNTLMKILSIPAITYLRAWDKVAASRPDIIISISTEVQQRIKKYYQRESELIFPPVSLFEHTSDITEKKENYFLVVSRLVPYKRIDLAIKACNKLGVSLKIVGEGSEKARLQAIAGPTIEFLGSVDDNALVSLYQKAKALLFPGFEDFGIVMVEALGFGTPVVAFDRGGAQDIIEHNKSGILFSRQSVSGLMSAMQELDKVTFRKDTLKKRAETFSQERFKKAFNRVIENSLQN